MESMYGPDVLEDSEVEIWNKRIKRTWREIGDAEQELFLIFDKMKGSTPPFEDSGSERTV